MFSSAMVGVNKRLPAHALIMGRAVPKDQKFLQSIKDEVSKTGLTHNFHFLPEVPVEDMADWYRVLDLYVAPQRSEGFGLTPIEAMACGVPVIATRVGAFEQIVTPQTGMLVDTDDPADLTNAICEAFEPPYPVKDWGKNARPHVAEHFSIEREAAELIKLYRKLLDEK